METLSSNNKYSTNLPFFFFLFSFNFIHSLFLPIVSTLSSVTKLAHAALILINFNHFRHDILDWAPLTAQSWNLFSKRIANPQWCYHSDLFMHHWVLWNNMSSLLSKESWSVFKWKWRWNVRTHLMNHINIFSGLVTPRRCILIIC